MSKSAVAQAVALILRSDGLRYSKPPITAPTLNAVPVSANQITVTASGATSIFGSISTYRWRRNGVLLNGGTPSTTPLVDTGLQPNTAYAYTASSVDAAGNESVVSVAASATTNASADVTAPTIPQSFNVSTISNSVLRCVWLPSTDSGGSGLAGYKVERSADGITGWAVVYTGTAATFDDVGLATLTRYYYRCRAYDNAGPPNFSSYSATGNALTASNVGGFARKPNIPTPALPSSFLRTFYADSAAAGGGLGTQASPFNSIGQFEAIKQAGDRLYVKGNFSAAGNERIGQFGQSGTLANPILYTLWPGEVNAYIQLGGLPNGYDTVYMVSGEQHHWFFGLTFRPNPGADQDDCIRILGGGRFNKFIACKIDNGYVHFNASPDNELWDCQWTDSDPTVKEGGHLVNAGSAFDFSNGSHRCRVIRGNLDTLGGHDCGLVGNVAVTNVGPPVVFFAKTDDCEIFDTYFRNPWAGGLQVVGLSDRTHVHWCTLHENGRDARAYMAANPGVTIGSSDGCQMTGLNTLFEFNQITYAGQFGMRLSCHLFAGFHQKQTNGVFRFNVIFGCKGSAVLMSSGAQCDPTNDLANNLFENNTAWGNNTAALVASPDANLSMGYYQGDWYPLVIDLYQNNGQDDGAGNNNGMPWPAGSLAGNVFRSNLWSRDANDTKFAMVVKNAGGLLVNGYYTLPQFESTFAGCVNNKWKQDPLFVNATARNFRVQPGSPCIDAGYPSSGVAFLNSAPDIGVYEFGGVD